jgi:hypothetical protein
MRAKKKKRDEMDRVPAEHMTTSCSGWVLPITQAECAFAAAYCIGLVIHKQQ